MKNIFGKFKNLFASKAEETMSHLVQKERTDFRSFAPVYGWHGNHVATVGHLTYNCDVIGTKGNILGQTEKVVRMYKPSERSPLGKMNVYEVTTSTTPYGKEFEYATIRKNNGQLGFEHITDRSEFKGYVKAMKMHSGSMKV